MNEVLIDTRGHRCPMPSLRLRRASVGAERGALFRLLCDDPMARIDVPHFADGAGLEVLDVTDQEGTLTFRIRRR